MEGPPEIVVDPAVAKANAEKAQRDADELRRRMPHLFAFETKAADEGGAAALAAASAPAAAAPVNATTVTPAVPATSAPPTPPAPPPGSPPCYDQSYTIYWHGWDGKCKCKNGAYGTSGGCGNPDGYKYDCYKQSSESGCNYATNVWNQYFCRADHTKLTTTRTARRTSPLANGGNACQCTSEASCTCLVGDSC